MESSFDLLLALFAGGISKAYVRYLKVGGRLLINNHQGGAIIASRDDRLELSAIIRFNKGKYQLMEENLDEHKITTPKLSSK
jgi:hypothetical protein